MMMTVVFIFMFRRRKEERTEMANLLKDLIGLSRDPNVSQSDRFSSDPDIIKLQEEIQQVTRSVCILYILT